MARTTAAEVRKALQSDAEDYPQRELDFHIDIAHRLVERRCAPHTTDEQGLTDTETYVAASLVVGGNDGDPRLSSVTQESGQVSWDWDATRDLAGPASSLWETAVMLDPTGRLADPPEGDDDVWTVAYGDTHTRGDR